MSHSFFITYIRHFLAQWQLGAKGQCQFLRLHNQLETELFFTPNRKYPDNWQPEAQRWCFGVDSKLTSDPCSSSISPN
jgi:hypothetical protein